MGINWSSLEDKVEKTRGGEKATHCTSSEFSVEPSQDDKNWNNEHYRVSLK